MFKCFLNKMELSFNNNNLLIYDPSLLPVKLHKYNALNV